MGGSDPAVTIAANGKYGWSRLPPRRGTPEEKWRGNGLEGREEANNLAPRREKGVGKDAQELEHALKTAVMHGRLGTST
ncbi:hypothetical protein GUJ93_ZPchr0013g34639 [Zizania palustris]|uniref:Uncharacterized protein n=1 Tax=Zizania palustris TaxID=103762 RepID=A0A8J5WW64_ZIZPA|nr:hypothetical protein GUJ93_ZPchr0013g34639 [Zizania palustris]